MDLRARVSDVGAVDGRRHLRHTLARHNRVVVGENVANCVRCVTTKNTQLWHELYGFIGVVDVLCASIADSDS